MRGEFLKLRRGRYTFRMRVPADLKGHLGTEITRDLGTANTRDAERAARRLASDYKGVFAALRAGAVLGPSGDARALVRRIADSYLAKLQRSIDDDLAEEVTPRRADEIAEAYGDAELNLSEQVEEDDYGDLVADALKGLPRGVAIDQEDMKALAAAIVRGLAKLSFDPDRQVRPAAAPAGLQGPQRPSPPYGQPAPSPAESRGTRAPVPPSSPTAPLAPSPSVSPAMPTGPSKLLGEALVLYLSEQLRSGNWENDRIQYHLHCKEFVEFIGPEIPMDDVEADHVLNWVHGLRKRNGEPLGIGTRNNRITSVSGFFERGRLRRWCVWNPAQKLRQTDERDASDKRDAFTMAEMQTLFGPALREASTSDGNRPARLWVPVLMLAAGLRQREAAQLAVEDIVDVDGITCVRVKADIDDQGKRGRRRAKTSASRRLVPLHGEVKACGFLDYVAARRAEVTDPKAPLFPDCPDDSAIKVLSTWGGDHLERIGVKRPLLSMYSLRHSLTTQLDHAGVHPTAQRQFTGHATGSDAHSGYVKGRGVAKLAADVRPALDPWLPEVFKNLKA